MCRRHGSTDKIYRAYKLVKDIGVFTTSQNIGTIRTHSYFLVNVIGDNSCTSSICDRGRFFDTLLFRFLFLRGEV